MLAQQNLFGKLETLIDAAAELHAFIEDAAKQGTAAHPVEQGVFERVLKIGRCALGQFFELQGSGDLGSSVTLPDGREVSRFEHTHRRPYVSVFGEFTLERTVYGSREGQKIDFVPLDARLALPESKFSYLLQDWDQMLTTEQPYGQVSQFLQKILGVRQHVDSLEHMSRQMTADAEQFCWSHTAPLPAEEGAILVESADAKGVPIRRPADAPAIYRHQHRSGPKPDQKKMAVLATVYSVDRFIRTPQDVVDALFSDPHQQKPDRPRPRPQHKRVYARLTQEDAEGQLLDAPPIVLGWMDQEVRQRWRGRGQEIVRIMDGQKSLWDIGDVLQSDLPTVDILDLLHVTPRLWQAAHVFHKPQTAHAEAFVRKRVLNILHGGVASVVRGLRRLTSLRKKQISAAQRQTINTLCNFFLNNQRRMQYDTYLKKGYPVASGAIEGACRHLIKDRMERTGMNWTINGAQAILSLRAIHIGGHWHDFIQYRIERETARLHPYRDVLNNHEWAISI